MPKLVLDEPKKKKLRLVLDEPIQVESTDIAFDPLDPNEVKKQANDVLDIAVDLESSIDTIETNYINLTEKPKKIIPGTILPSGIGEPTELKAAPERTKWQKFKKFFVGERPPLPPNADRIEKLERAFDIGIGSPLRVFLKFSKGMTLNAPDLMWAAIKRITPDDMWDEEVKNMTLDEAMDWAGGYNPSGFQKSVGEIAEFVGRIKTVAPIAQKLGVIGGTPKDISVLGKAFETAKLFGTAAIVEQVTKGASDIIEPTEAEYGFEGPKAVLRDMALGAIFSLVSQGVKGLWSKLTPSEYARALKLLGLKKGATQEQITKAANSLARQYHPDKAKGLVDDFKQVIKARDFLRQGEVKDIVYRGQKLVLKPKLLPSETPSTKAISAPSKPVKAKTPAESKYGGIPFPSEEPGKISLKEAFERKRKPAQPPAVKGEAVKVEEPVKIGDTFIDGTGVRNIIVAPSVNEATGKVNPNTWIIRREGETTPRTNDVVVFPWQLEKAQPPAKEALKAPAEPEAKIEGKAEPITKEEKNLLRSMGYSVSDIIGMDRTAARKLIEKPRDILGGVDPINQIHIALKAAKAVRPITEAAKKEALRKRVGAAAGSLKASLNKGMPAEQAILKSTGLLRGPLTEYNQIYESIEDTLEPGAKDAAYQMIATHPELKYFDVVNTQKSFQKLLAGSDLTPKDAENIERVFGKVLEDVVRPRTTKSDLYDRVVSIWKAGLLTGIKTTGLNTLANVSHAMTETAKDIPASLVDSVTSLFTGERATAFTARGVPGGVIKGFERGWKYLKTGLDERNVGAKLDYKRVNFGTGRIARGLQAYEETIFHLLGAEDQPFYYGAKARSLYSQAIAQAMNKSKNKEWRKTYVDNAVQNPTNDMLEAAVHDAEVAVFQNRTHLGDIAKSIQKVKGGEVIVPFGRTPSAVAMQIVNYSPIGAVKEVAEQIHAGKFNQRKFSQAFGRATVGTGALFIGGLLLRKGLMTLDYPDNERERELWRLEGRQANSILIDGKWRTIQTLGPVGNVLIIGGHFERQLKKEGSPTKAIVTALAGGAKSFSEQTFVRGVNMAVDALTSPERSFENWFSSMAGSAVPTIVADIARAQDDISRRAVGPKEKVQTRIPIWRKGLEPAIDVFGQDLPRYGGNVLETMADPTRPSVVRQDIVIEELRRLFDKDIKVSPTLLGDKAGYDILTKEENTQLWRRAGELTYKGLLAQINSGKYKKANDYAKGKLIELVTGQSKTIAKLEIVKIKLAQGKTIMKLAESGLFTIEEFEALKYFQESKGGLKE